jgi:hypothetical protein
MRTPRLREKAQCKNRLGVDFLETLPKSRKKSQFTKLGIGHFFTIYKRGNENRKKVDK